MIFQAPVGGAISPVNRQHYEGGQFMPDTGLFCGIKKKAKKFAKTDRNWSDLVITNNLLVYARFAGTKYDKYLVSKPFEHLNEAVAFCDEVLRLRGEDYSKRGFVPHPTRFLVEGV